MHHPDKTHNGPGLSHAPLPVAIVGAAIAFWFTIFLLIIF